MYLKNILSYMDMINVPNDLKDEHNALKLLTIIFPQTLRKIRPFEYAEEREDLNEVFKENCASRRLRFFKDPLVKFLWNNVFMQHKPHLLTSHLRWIKSDPDNGDIALLKFVSCLKVLEECQIRFTIDGTKLESDSIESFSQAEKHDYLIQNGKFNKRQTVKVQNNIADLK